MQKPNGILEMDVRDELDWDPLLDDSRVVVKADNGTVVLSGAVPTYYDSVLAFQDASDVVGVTHVDNKLLVGPAGEAVADKDIAADAAAHLDGDRFVPHGAVTADVDNGWVTLKGSVRHHFQRQAAEYAVRRVNGVLGITDKIEINADPIPSDVTDRIKKAFHRHAMIDDSAITVSNKDHTIYLDGTVKSWPEESAAVDTAWAAPGVSDVVDRLVVVP